MVIFQSKVTYKWKRIPLLPCLWATECLIRCFSPSVKGIPDRGLSTSWNDNLGSSLQVSMSPFLIHKARKDFKGTVKMHCLVLHMITSGTNQGKCFVGNWRPFPSIPMHSEDHTQPKDKNKTRSWRPLENNTPSLQVAYG